MEYENTSERNWKKINFIIYSKFFLVISEIIRENCYENIIPKTIKGKIEYFFPTIPLILSFLLSEEKNNKILSILILGISIISFFVIKLNFANLQMIIFIILIQIVVLRIEYKKK